MCQVDLVEQCDEGTAYSLSQLSWTTFWTTFWTTASHTPKATLLLRWLFGTIWTKWTPTISCRCLFGPFLSTCHPQVSSNSVWYSGYQVAYYVAFGTYRTNPQHWFHFTLPPTIPTPLTSCQHTWGISSGGWLISVANLNLKFYGHDHRVPYPIHHRGW